MLKSLTLRNFRGFYDHKIEFSPESILIGQNNAGKTTAIEALRVLSVCQRKIPGAFFVPSPSWLNGVPGGAGFRVSLETIDFDFANVHHAYDTNRPAVILAKFTNHSEIHIYIGISSDEVFYQIRTSAKLIVHSRTGIGNRFSGSVRVMPPVGSLLAHEKTITKQRLARYLDGYLAYRHFRNQLWEKPSEYRLFQTLLEATWHGLKIQHFENDHGPTRNEFSLLVREGRFTSEISWHGHGLQAWMQTIWFLARVPPNSTVVLDEPDVYLHADLQRKLIKVIEGLGFTQAIVATHSPEIIGDVPFNNVTVINKQDRVSKPAENASQIQLALRSMGSLHSIQLAKLAQHGLLLFVEGDDKSYLTDVAYKLGSRVFDSFSKIAVQEIKGKGNWRHALGAAQALALASNGDIKTALLVDRDYMIPEEIRAMEDKALKSGLILKIWGMKEIENYFIDAVIIGRHIAARCEGLDVDLEQISDFMNEVSEALLEDAILSFADVIQKFSKQRIETKTAFNRAKEVLNELISSGMEIREIVDGKDFISALSAKTHKAYGVSITPLALCKEMQVHEIPAELAEFVTSIATNQSLEPGCFNHDIIEAVAA